MTKTHKILILVTIIMCGLIAVSFIIYFLFCVFSPYRDKAKSDLIIAVRESDIETVVEILDKYPALSNESRHEFSLWRPVDTTPLEEAVRFGDFEIVKLLVERGADVNKSCSPYYPLTSLKTFDSDILWYLIDNGADVTFKGKGSYAKELIYCIFNYKDDSDSDLAKEKFDLIVYILNEWQKFGEVSSLEFVPDIWILSAIEDNYLIIEYMLENQMIDINSKADSWYKKATALIYAVENQNYLVVEILLDYGADTDIIDDLGKTAMDYAIELNDEKLIEMLSE